jgi:hypothetical protein
MASWNDVVHADREFAAHVRRTFAIRKHATLATLRRDGSPRISGTEVQFDDDGEIYLGVMPGSRKLADLRRDPRLALHCPTEDAPEQDPAAWLGDGKISGSAVGAGEDRVRIDIAEVVLTRVGTPADHLLITSWHPGRGIQELRRR